MFSYLRTLITRYCPRSPAAAAAAAVDRYIHGSKPAAAGLLLWARAGTDRRTDPVPFHKLCSAYYAGSVINNVCIIANSSGVTSAKRVARYAEHYVIQF